MQPTATATTPTATTPTTATTPGTGSSPPGTQASGGARPSVDIGAPAGDGGSNDGLVALVIALALIGAAVGAALVVLAAKRRRRAARRARLEPAEAIAGAWEEALDRLRDRGVLTTLAATSLEIAEEVPRVAGPATAEPLGRLARAHSAACYGVRAPGPTDVDDAWAQLDALEAALEGGTSRWERIRRRLDPRTLRSDRQPVPAGWLSAERSSSTND